MACQKVIDRNETIFHTFPTIRIICLEIQELDELKNNDAIQKLTFSNNFIRRMLRDNDVIFSNENSNSLADYDPDFVGNFDESPFCLNLTGGRVVKQIGMVYNII